MFSTYLSLLHYACHATKQLSDHMKSFDLQSETNCSSLEYKMLFLSSVHRKISVGKN
jgi:hypothetical protein